MLGLSPTRSPSAPPNLKGRALDAQQLLIEAAPFDLDVEIIAAKAGTHGSGFTPRAILVLSGPMTNIEIEVFDDGVGVIDGGPNCRLIAPEDFDKALEIAVMRSLYREVCGLGYAMEMKLTGMHWSIRFEFGPSTLFFYYAPDGAITSSERSPDGHYGNKSFRTVAEAAKFIKDF